ncbi:uncharacterized protein LOC122182560 [Lagopus leucura]|uniref:uncharacterized protein LOC122182560 n=1 Tax=Lagopus leucura TaxID=30410 RepID=UPI001C66615C|nr:uncharacterized protein LOC122182560 [Lagopus leucura]XP_042731900.1 uncharacterized protein LOC122182560 [Lagopus leucura]XP_042731902.1 uncharacterized protein LOC122182560 [Lagopus leucura]XP_042731903.1 uncharacterized protein LOC122182560 [Lagopus leucura]
MGKDHFFPQAAEERVLTGSQQPYRNIFEAQLAARTVWYVAGARLSFYCAYTSCNLPSGMLIFQSLAQHQEFRIVSHGYFLWKNFFKELTQPGNGNQTGTKLLHTCQSPIACSRREAQCVSLTSGARKREVETGFFHLRWPQAKSKHTWTITVAQAMRESIFEMLASFLKNNENKQNKTANSKRKPPAPDFHLSSQADGFNTWLQDQALLSRLTWTHFEHRFSLCHQPPPPLQYCDSKRKRTGK